MKKYWEVTKRKLIIYPTPTENGGLIKIRFKPSKYWLKKHGYEQPIITTPKYAGQQTYYLPKYFRRSTIEMLDF